MKKLLLVAALSTLTACESEDLFSSDSDDTATPVSVLTFEAVKSNNNTASYTFDGSYTVNDIEVKDGVTWHWTVAKTTGEHKALHPVEDPSHTFGEPGEYKISAKVSETDGDVLAEKSIFMDILESDIDETTTFPVPVITVTGKNGLTITLDSSASSYTKANGDAGTISETEWIIDGQIIPQVQTQYTFPADGTYPISLKVVSEDDTENSITEQITVQEEPSIPVADFTYTANKLEVALDSTASTNRTSMIAVYDWDLGNGTTSDIAKPTVTYPAEGDYTVTLTVTTNENKTDSIEKVLSVKEEASYVTCDVISSDYWGFISRGNDEKQCFTSIAKGPLDSKAKAEAWCADQIAKYKDTFVARIGDTNLTTEVRQTGNNECAEKVEL